MSDLDQGTEREYLFAALSQFVATQQQMADSLSQMSAAVQALVSKEMSDYEPKFKRRLTEYADFDWSSIDAKPASWDGDGLVSSVEYLGFIWVRRCSRENDKFGNTIRFNRTRKKAGEELEYLDLIAFSEKGATIDALNSHVLAIVKKSRKNVPKATPPVLPQGTQQPITIPAHSNSRPNVSYPLQSSNRPAPQSEPVDELKVQRQKELRQLIGTNKISVDDVVAISLAKYGVKSSDDMSVQQIEELYQHLSVVYSIAVPVPGQ